MKSIFITISTILVLSLQSCISLHISENDFDAQYKTGKHNPNLKIIESYTVNNSSGDWSITQENAEFKSKFRKYSGTSSVMLNVSEPMKALLKLTSSVSKGEMKIQISDAEGKLLLSDVLTSNHEINQEFNFEKTGNYDIKLIGENTSGTLSVYWEEKE